MTAALDQHARAVRRFNRFYTQKIGVLQEGLLSSPFSLAQVRVLYELAHREHPTATELARDLAIDAGYLSRMLSDFEKRGLVEKRISQVDGRQSLLQLTKAGFEAFAPLDARAQEEVRNWLAPLTLTRQDTLVDAMRNIEAIFGGESLSASEASAYLLRPHQPGDMGWVVHRHGVLYAQEYGWDEHFEALVAGIVAEFIQRYDQKRERCWIAEKDGEIVGSVFLVQQSKTIAKLRLLLVEPSARGLGIGGRLVSECVRFARQAGYKRITLWTQSMLHAARRIYKKAGFRLVRKQSHRSFGHDLIGETWELQL